LFLLCLIVALFVPGVTVVFSIIGATLGVAVIFLFPAAFAWKLRHKTNYGIHLAFVISATVVGIMIAATGTRTIYGVTTPYMLEYDFINFKAGDPGEDNFLPPISWECFKNPYNLYVTFVVGAPDSDFLANNFTNKLAEILQIPYYFINIMSQNPEPNNRTSAMVEIGVKTQDAIDDVIFLIETKVTTQLTVNSTLFDGVIESISYSRQLSCPTGCGNGACYFGSCKCQTGYEGDLCDTVTYEEEIVRTSSKGVNPGEAAGIAVAFFFFGLIIGGVAFYFIFRRRVEAKATTKMIKMEDRSDTTTSVELNN